MGTRYAPQFTFDPLDAAISVREQERKHLQQRLSLLAEELQTLYVERYFLRHPQRTHPCRPLVLVPIPA